MISKEHNLKGSFIKALVAVFIGLLILTIVTVNHVILQDKKLSGRIYPNVYIDNQNVGKKTKEEAIRLFSKQNSRLQKTFISVVYKDELIATFSAQKLNLHSNIKDLVERAYLVSRMSYFPSRIQQKIDTIFNLGRYDFQTSIIYDQDKIQEFLSFSESKYNKPARDALFKFEGNRVVSFRKEENGIKIESEKFSFDLDKEIVSLKERQGNKVVKLQDKIIQPEVTLAKSNQFGIEELIAVGQSNFSGSIPERIDNISLAASRLNGVLIPKGEEFSFNKSVGEISRLTGYKQAYVIKSGKTVLDDGGGVCQVSTTVFRAALNAGLPIIERTAHAYRVGYYENDSKPGFDATVFSPSVDFRFKNDTPAAILIQTEIDQANNILRFKFYGKRDGRNVEISNARVWDIAPPLPEIKQDDPTLKKGVIKQVDFAAWGAKASFHYKVTKDGNVNFEKEFYSAFRPWQAVYLIGIAD